MTEDEKKISKIQEDLASIKGLIDKNNILLVNKVSNMEKDISDLESSLKGYVTYDRFSLIERVVVSTIALVLITVGASLLRLIITK